MVKSREELLSVAASNAEQLKAHIRQTVVNFMNTQGVNQRDLAYVLGITEAQLAQIIAGDGNVTIDVLSKLLVATDLVVEVKPIRNTPLGGYGRKMPRSGGFPAPGGFPQGIPVDRNGRPLPPPPGFPPSPMGAPQEPGREEIPMETVGPARDEHGRFVKRNARPKKAGNAQRQEAPVTNYHAMPDVELINIIRQNIWDGEINVDTATHQQLAEFVANKERIMRERTNPAPQAEAPQAEQPQPQVKGGSNLKQFLEMLGNVAREAQNNPQLMDVISRFMPNNG